MIGSTNANNNNNNNNATATAAAMNNNHGLDGAASELAYMAENVRADRVSQGLCPTCGTKLYQIKKRGVLSVKRRDATFKPLTIEGQVDRGQCLKCNSGSGEDNSAALALAAMLSVADQQQQEEAQEQQQEHAEQQHAELQQQLQQEQVPVQDLLSLGQDKVNNDNNNNNGGGGGTFVEGPTATAQAVPLDLTTDFGGIPAAVVESPLLPGNSTNSSGSGSGRGVDAVYKGNYNVYGERHGQGELNWSNGDRYTGTFWNGVREGEGTLHFADGSEFVGFWENNKMHGDGTRRFPNGNVYTGQYNKGKRSGQGRCYFANGDMYNGGWLDDLIHGFGRYYYSNGQSFEGSFRLGKRHGRGKYQLTDGRLDVYKYQDDIRVGEGVRWSANRKKAWRLVDGKQKSKVSLQEAIEIAKRCGEQDENRSGPL